MTKVLVGSPNNIEIFLINSDFSSFPLGHTPNLSIFILLYFTQKKHKKDFKLILNYKIIKEIRFSNKLWKQFVIFSDLYFGKLLLILYIFYNYDNILLHISFSVS